MQKRKRQKRKKEKWKSQKRKKRENSTAEILAQYNSELAINAIHILMRKGLCDWEESLESIYHPIQALLEELTKRKPRFLFCFPGETYSYQKPGFPPEETGFSADIFIVGPQNKIAYLGTVLDKKESYILWRWFLKNFPQNRNILRRRGPMTIVRQRTKCRIPTKCPKLNRQALEEAVRKYMKTFCPALANVQIKWISEQKRKILINHIYQEAEKKANSKERKSNA